MKAKNFYRQKLAELRREQRIERLRALIAALAMVLTMLITSGCVGNAQATTVIELDDQTLIEDAAAIVIETAKKIESSRGASKFSPMNS